MVTFDTGCYQFEDTRNAYSLLSGTSCKNTNYKNEKDKSDVIILSWILRK
jgi:hypothetical protein